MPQSARYLKNLRRKFGLGEFAAGGGRSNGKSRSTGKRRRKSGTGRMNPNVPYQPMNPNVPYGTNPNLPGQSGGIVNAPFEVLNPSLQNELDYRQGIPVQTGGSGVKQFPPSGGQTGPS